LIGRSAKIFAEWLTGNKGLFFGRVRVCVTPQDQEDLFQEIAAKYGVRSPAIAEMRRSPLDLSGRLEYGDAWTQRNGSIAKESERWMSGSAFSRRSATDPRVECSRANPELSEIDRSLTPLLLDGFSYKEMAAMLGITENYVGGRSVY
jgi:RNA polymerase sigma-70 factor (ECF subfamily)